VGKRHECNEAKEGFQKQKEGICEKGRLGSPETGKKTEAGEPRSKSEKVAGGANRKDRCNAVLKGEAEAKV